MFGPDKKSLRKTRIGCTLIAAPVVGLLLAPSCSKRLDRIFDLEMHTWQSMAVSMVIATLLAGLGCYVAFRND
jgi:hypothetical protein